MLTRRSLNASTIGTGVALGILAIAYRWLRKRNNRVPPGPPRYPLVGNLLNFPSQGWTEIFPEWHKKYGNFVYANLMGTPVFIIGDREVAEELLNMRGGISAGRPPNVLVMELMGWDEWNLPLIPPGKLHSNGRFLMRKATSRNVIGSYRTLIEAHNRLFLKNALGMVGDPSSLVNQAVGQFITRLTYADALSKEEARDLIEKNEESFRLSTEAFSRVYLVNIIPMLKYIPAWVPGAGFQRLAAHVKNLTYKIRNGPWENVLKDVDSGVHRASLADKLIEQHGANGTTRDSAAIIYSTAQSTTATSILTSIYALLMYPAVQSKAFEEIHRVIGHDRFPTLADLDNLPYMEALWKETLRWSPPLPIILPHLTTEDTVYDGYFVPKGSMLLAHVKYMLRDERFWDEPEVFKPERFLGELKEGQVDPKSLIFGFGRRICPGRDMANQLVPAYVMTLLWAFEITPVGGEARPDPKNPQFVDSAVVCPAPFRCQFRPRSERVARLIREVTIGA